MIAERDPREEVRAIGRAVRRAGHVSGGDVDRLEYLTSHGCRDCGSVQPAAAAGCRYCSGPLREREG